MADVADDNVIPLKGREPIDPDLVARLSNDDLISGIRGYTDNAAERLTAAIPRHDSIDNVNRSVRQDTDSHLSDDERWAVQEFNTLLAKYGKTPVNSVEGIIALRSMLVDAYRDNLTVPRETQLKLLDLDRKIAVLQSTEIDYQKTQATIAQKQVVEAQGQVVRAQAQLIEAEGQLVTTRAELEATKITAALKGDDATTEVTTRRVTNRRKRGIAENDDRVTDKVLDNDHLEKWIDAHRQSARIIWWKGVRPIVRPILKVVIWVTVIGMVASFFVESAQIPMYPILGPFDAIRHLLGDPIYGTVHNWITHASN